MRTSSTLPEVKMLRWRPRTVRTAPRKVSCGLPLARNRCIRSSEHSLAAARRAASRRTRSLVLQAVRSLMCSEPCCPTNALEPSSSSHSSLCRRSTNVAAFSRRASQAATLASTANTSSTVTTGSSSASSAANTADTAASLDSSGSSPNSSQMLREYRAPRRAAAVRKACSSRSSSSTDAASARNASALICSLVTSELGSVASRPRPKATRAARRRKSMATTHRRADT
mmetsp:Transcript_74831/g.173409  ORF Transcript_74831/g.173409 Transcript_74831/m.173409 type:complete len:228 (+) Transcript_74831:257-940(+)